MKHVFEDTRGSRGSLAADKFNVPDTRQEAASFMRVSRVTAAQRVEGEPERDLE